jgi:DNA-binding beta-propeller fold protein YncE
MLMTLAIVVFSQPVMAEAAPLVLVRSMKIPSVPIGPYSDHLAVDAVDGRVFATPQAAHEVAVFNYRSGRLLKVIHGIGNPHGIYYDANLRRLFVVDGASGELKVFNGDSYELMKSIHLRRGADALTVDVRTNSIFVNNGGVDARMTYSLVSVVNMASMRKLYDIRIDAPSLEGSAVDSRRQLLYVALDTRHAVAVVNLRSRRTASIWTLPIGYRDMAVAVDPLRRRLYVACRDSAMRGSLLVLSTSNGRVLRSLPIGGWTDGIGFDRRRSRIYVPTGDGHIYTYALQSNGAYEQLPTVDTSILGKTGVYSNAADLLFVDVPELYPARYERARVMEFRPVK